MKLIPRQSETVISTFSPAAINRRLDGLTASPSLRSEQGEDKVFQGRVRNRTFVLSRKVRHANNFIPLVHGKIEATSKGSIIFIRYSLFRSSLIFLSFAIGIAFIVGICFILFGLPKLYIITAFALGLANYLVTLLNFNRQVRLTHESLLDALNIDESDINDPAYFS